VSSLVQSRLSGTAVPLFSHRFFRFDHGVVHRLLLLCHAKAPNYGKKKAFKDLAYYSEWPKVADAVIKAEWNSK